jgi:hypothetical protein
LPTWSGVMPGLNLVLFSLPSVIKLRLFFY